MPTPPSRLPLLGFRFPFRLPPFPALFSPVATCLYNTKRSASTLRGPHGKGGNGENIDPGSAKRSGRFARENPPPRVSLLRRRCSRDFGCRVRPVDESPERD